MEISGVAIGALCGIVGFLCGTRAPLGAYKALQQELQDKTQTFVRIERKRQAIWRETWKNLFLEMKTGAIEIKNPETTEVLSKIYKSAFNMDPVDFPPTPDPTSER